MIPKIIHQIWLQGWNELPSKFIAGTNSIVEKNPGYTIMKWDDKSLLNAAIKLGPSYTSKYNSFKLIHQKVDYGRYIVLYLYGGISVDVDTVAIRGFDTFPYMSDSFIVSLMSNSKQLNNATILTVPGNKLMLGLIDYINTTSCAIGQSKFSCIQNTTGPNVFNKYLSDKIGVTIVESSWFESCSGYDKYCEINNNAIIDHQHEGSWVPNSFKKGMKLKHWFNHLKHHNWRW